MPHIKRWFIGSLVFGAAGTIVAITVLNSLYAFLFYVPYVAALIEMERQTLRFRRGKNWAVWTGEEYPWGTLHDVYAVKHEAEQAVDKLRGQGQYAYMTYRKNGSLI